MPELPEIETIRLALSPIEGLHILRAAQSANPLRWRLSPEQLNDIEGEQIVSLRRRGRHLLILLANGSCLLIHLGMSGWLRHQPTREPAIKHDHFQLMLSDSSWLVLNDPRRFGGVMLSRRHDALDLSIIAALGAEPLDPSVTPQTVKTLYNRSTKGIKELLMDNSKITGIGNIYASEILFKAKIHPDKPGSKITMPNAHAILDNIRATLNQAIVSGGSTLRDFKHTNGESGSAQMLHQVYAKTGLPCPRCSRPLKKSAHGGRSTFFCSACQKRR